MLTPKTTKALVDAGYTVNVERSSERIFDDSEFEAAGATLVPEGSWTEVPAEHIVCGLKELPEESCMHASHNQPFQPSPKAAARAQWVMPHLD